MGPLKYQGAFGDKQLRHLLRRTLIGYNKADLEKFEGLGLDAVLDELLLPLPAIAAPVNNYEVNYPDPQVPKGEVWLTKPAAWALDPEEGGKIELGRNTSMMISLLRGALQGEPRLHHKLLFFWHNHFGNQTGFVEVGKMSYRHFSTLWRLAYGSFREMIYEVTIDPHMLAFLNGTANFKDEPDENFARELQELFCIGKGPKANYTESDVQEAARVLTGWGIRWETITEEGAPISTFFDFQHETRNKQFSEFYGGRRITGREGERGADELDELLDMIVGHPECARFICRKLHRYFISHQISDETEQVFIEPLAELFIAEDYRIEPVLKALFSSAYFFEEKNIGAMIKAPLDVMGGFIRNNSIDYIADPTDLDEDYWTHLLMIHNMDLMGYHMGNPPSVAGWPAYYQIPAYDKLWVTTFTLITRIILSDGFIHDGFWTPQKSIPFDYLAYTSSLDDPADPTALIEELCQTHLAVPIDKQRKDQLKSILLTGQATDSYWTDAWFEYLSDPSNDSLRSIVDGRLKFFYISFFQMPEYQLL